MSAHSRHRVQGDSLEADEVVSRGHGGGNDRRPRRVVGDHLACGPCSVEDGARDQASLLNLELTGAQH